MAATRFLLAPLAVLAVASLTAAAMDVPAGRPLNVFGARGVDSTADGGAAWMPAPPRTTQRAVGANGTGRGADRLFYPNLGTQRAVAVDADGGHGVPPGAGGAPAPPPAADVTACVASATALLKNDTNRSFGGEAGATRLKDLLAAAARALAATDGSRRGAPPPLVVDVGANTGQGLLAWRAIFPGARVVAVEANPALAGRLANLSRAGTPHWRGVTVINAAVGNASASTVFRLPRDARLGQLGGMWASAKRPWPERFDYVTIPMEPLDVLLSPPHTPAGLTATRRTHPISLLKTDTEGWDIPVLAAAPRAVAAARFILWECHRFMATEGGPRTSHAAAAELLAAAGFEVYKLGATASLRFDGPFAVGALDEPAYMGWHNCLALRRDEPLRAAIVGGLGVPAGCAGAYGVPVAAEV